MADNKTTKDKDGVFKRDVIHIKGARTNNLQNIDVDLPKNKLIVVTGVSGSGKSSLTMDTLYAEGQRRYVESLSSYARQFLNRMKKPEVDYIKGICPAIAIEQKVSGGNNRSTVGSMTEIYDYLRLLFARIGKTYSPVTGQLVKKHEVSDVVDFIMNNSDGTRVSLYIPLNHKYGSRSIKQELQLLEQKGYSRIMTEERLQHIQDILDSSDSKWDTLLENAADLDVLVLIDRFAVSGNDEENKKRIADSVNMAFSESEGNCVIEVEGKGRKAFNNRFEADGIEFVTPSPQLFNYNNPFGACPTCEGYGKTIGIDETLVIPDASKSVYEGAIACWRGESGQHYLKSFLKKAIYFDFPVHRAYEDLTDEEKKLLWEGNEHFDGINAYFRELESQIYKIQYRVLLSKYKGKTTCPTCNGSRLRPEATYVKINGWNITQWTNIPVDELLPIVEGLDLHDNDRLIAKRILTEITSRLQLMVNIGLDYLTLERISSTLSGGETQRIQLTRTLGSNLTNSMYLLDEPSIGLHLKDTKKLAEVLLKLRDLGNTVVVVEHEEEIINHADYLIDIGPKAGIHGGRLVYAGPASEIGSAVEESLTAQYLTGKTEVPVPVLRRPVNTTLKFKGARQNNLRKIDVTIPLHAMTVITGVSGSGKSTLVRDIIYPELMKNVNPANATKPGPNDGIEGNWTALSALEWVDQNPIGKSSRSNPVTYVKVYDHIRNLFANQHLAKVKGFKPLHFSFNVEGGRCEVCKGEGEITIEMQFLADVKLECEECHGQRFKKEVLDVKYNDKTIFDVLNMSIEEGIEFFHGEKDIAQRLKPLYDVGLGYVKLGQSSSTLSGGEAQRLKLASFLGLSDAGNQHIFFIFDEPTTGLHFHDVRRLLDAMNALVNKGHTVLIVEHNLDVIKNADWVVDLGPGGGKHGGKLVFEGRPEDLAKVAESYTGQYLKAKLHRLTDVQPLVRLDA